MLSVNHQCSVPIATMRYQMMKGIAKRDVVEKRSEVCQFVRLPIDIRIKQLYNYVYVRLVHYILYSQLTGMNCSIPFKGKHRLKFFLDVQDGKIMNSHVYGGFLTRPEHLALMLNTDGVQKFKSSSLNIWPVYLAITNFPPHLRMNLDYIILAGAVKPPMNTLLTPVVSAITSLTNARAKLVALFLIYQLDQLC